MQEKSKKYLLDLLYDNGLYDALIDLIDSKVKDNLAVIGSIDKDPIAKIYKLISVDASMSAFEDIKATLAEIHSESIKQH